MEDLKYYRVRISFEKHIEAESEQEAKEITLECMDNEPNHIEWEVEELRKGRKQCVVHACKETLDKVDEGRMYTHVERCEEAEADFFGVYEVMPDGTEKWLGDFRTHDDASMFALEKEKEEIKLAD